MTATQHHDELVQELLAKPTGPQRVRAPRQAEFTRELELSGSTLTATITGEVGQVTEGTARDFLTEEGQDPDEWIVTGFRKSRWGSEHSPQESVAFTFKRAAAAESERLGLDEILDSIEAHWPTPARRTGSSGALVLIGDMQFGKTDGDGVAGTLERTIACIDNAADNIAIKIQDGYDIGHVHVAWLGDHIEGFVSQKGDNAWRTDLTLNEQIRLTRRVMLHALTTFAALGVKLTMAAVPGNHGEAVRFGGGVTRYDDSHDTESLIAVADAVVLTNDRAVEQLDVEFYVPETDELTVVVDVAGTTVAHAHGHQWKPGNQFNWWKGQAFNANSSMHDAHLLVAGHLHHLHVDTDGPRSFIGVPALESESTWFRHRTGTIGAPGIVLALTSNGNTDVIEVIRP